MKPIKQHLKKHRRSYWSYVKWEFRSKFFIVDCSRPYLRMSIINNPNIWNID